MKRITASFLVTALILMCISCAKSAETEFTTYTDIKSGVLERFLSYVIHDTQSDSSSDTSPSTDTQIEFAKILAAECRAIGLTEVTLCDNGIIMATLPANINVEVPVIGFIAHIDTAPDASGSGVVPRIHENYDGEDIVLDFGTVISPNEFPVMENYIGQTIITASGDTLLGADDKAGVAIILTAMEYLIQNPDIPHGKIRIAFTPDEEIGRGTVNFDVEAFGADFAFTVDSGPLGNLTYETFNAAAASIEVNGKAIHPGYAKGILVNSAIIAAEFASALPRDESPENTSGYEGYYHLLSLAGNVEKTTMSVIIRSFDTDDFAERKQFIEKLVDDFNVKYGAGTIVLDLNDQYYNMSEKIDDWLIEYAKAAFIAAGVEPVTAQTRGGTDGARLSFMGLPTPNIFTGMHNYHGLYEFITLETMVKAVEVVVELARAS
ncbi:MAG: peptidase T [Oscillospiraceae bacterium]|nr:peptidase T [Oscillospiraceae bacterium]